MRSLLHVLMMHNFKPCGIHDSREIVVGQLTLGAAMGFCAGYAVSGGVTV